MPPPAAKFGVAFPKIPGAGRHEIATFARKLEDLGFDSLWVFDRLVYDNLGSISLLGALAVIGHVFYTDLRVYEVIMVTSAARAPRPPPARQSHTDAMKRRVEQNRRIESAMTRRLGGGPTAPQKAKPSAASLSSAPGPRVYVCSCNHGIDLTAGFERCPRCGLAIQLSLPLPAITRGKL